MTSSVLDFKSESIFCDDLFFFKAYSDLCCDVWSCLFFFSKSLIDSEYFFIFSRSSSKKFSLEYFLYLLYTTLYCAIHVFKSLLLLSFTSWLAVVDNSVLKYFLELEAYFLFNFNDKIDSNILFNLLTYFNNIVFFSWIDSVEFKLFSEALLNLFIFNFILLYSSIIFSMLLGGDVSVLFLGDIEGSWYGLAWENLIVFFLLVLSDNLFSSFSQELVFVFIVTEFFLFFVGLSNAFEFIWSMGRDSLFLLLLFCGFIVVLFFLDKLVLIFIKIFTTI